MTAEPARSGAPMDERELRLDGNALAGELQSMLGVDLTAAQGRCAGCGRVAELAAQLLYRYPHAPGAALRCGACGNLLLVVVEHPRGVRLAMPGLSWISASVG